MGYQYSTGFFNINGSEWHLAYRMVNLLTTIHARFDYWYNIYCCFRIFYIEVWKKNLQRITQHKRFSLRAHPNSAFGRTSFMLETLGEMLKEKRCQHIAQHGISGSASLHPNCYATSDDADTLYAIQKIFFR